MWPKIWFNVRIYLQVTFNIGEFDFFKPNNWLKYRSLRFGGGNGWFALFKVTQTTGWFISETEHTLFWVSLCSKFWAMWPVSVRKKDRTISQVCSRHGIKMNYKPDRTRHKKESVYDRLWLWKIWWHAMIFMWKWIRQVVIRGSGTLFSWRVLQGSYSY